jgi:ATP-dependent Clp protease ATP-binding subunit ClpB
MEINSVPEEIDELNRKITQLEIEKEAIKRERDNAKQSQLSKELAELTSQRDELMAKWRNEKDVVDTIQQSKQQIEELKTEAEQAERNGDYERVAEIRYGKLKELEQAVESAKAELANMQATSAMIKEEVDSDDIAEVVARWTGIPVSKMMQTERAKLLNLENELHKRVVGQQEAIEAVANAVRRSRAGVQDARKPIGSFIFLGTTGVGKTELAKSLADFLFDDESHMVRIDMSEYQEKHSVSRLIGAPPGYVGYDEGGQLTESVRRKPYSVILLDEIEKAHPDVFNILLQVLDDGILTDNKGRTVDFKNTIIIMTSNIGSEYINEQLKSANESNFRALYDKTSEMVFNKLKSTMRPEFLNRVDEIVMFTPLDSSQIKEIVELQFNIIAKRLAGNGVELKITDEALEWLGNNSFDPQYGARPIKRAVQRYILNELSTKILANEIDKDKPVTITVAEENLRFEN